MLDAAGVPHLDNPSHIVPVMVGDPVRCKAMADALLDEHGIYVQPINYPTVPRNTERLRITPSPVHSAAEMQALVTALAAVFAQIRGPARGLIGRLAGAGHRPAQSVAWGVVGGSRWAMPGLDGAGAARTLRDEVVGQERFGAIHDARIRQASRPANRGCDGDGDPSSRFGWPHAEHRYRRRAASRAYATPGPSRTPGRPSMVGVLSAPARHRSKFPGRPGRPDRHPRCIRRSPCRRDEERRMSSLRRRCRP